MAENINEEHKQFTPKGSKEEAKFLDGPNSRLSEFKFLIQVVKEFVYGFRKLHFVGPCVTVFGSARFAEDHKYYQLTRNVSREIAKLGFTIMTGGGPGVMEAANRGAKEVGGPSVGCNILLPHEQHPNKYLDAWVDFDFFFVRKTLLSKYSYAFVVMPGGYGTLDEFFEAMTLIQTGKFLKFPIVLMGVEFHQDLYRHLQTMKEEKTIDPEDLKLFLFTDSIEEAIMHLDKYAVQGFKLHRMKNFKPIKILGEKKLKQNLPG